jgi:uncharacterized membrane protein YfhO
VRWRRRTSLSTKGKEAIGKVHIDQYQPTKLMLTADMLQPGWLILSENYYPGWNVRIDGQPGKIYRADYLFRAVSLAAGTHKIEMVFEPPSFITGAIVSLVTLGGLLLIGIAAWRLERRRA